MDYTSIQIVLLNIDAFTDFLPDLHLQHLWFQWYHPQILLAITKHKNVLTDTDYNFDDSDGIADLERPYSEIKRISGD